jgi:alkanesulfonate monooxygenase SsuD/methylene tetrahydromethanopterin reductase-like flavin-dependent oxidoreductase (luciferase family)
MTAEPVRIGLRPPHAVFRGGPGTLRTLVERAEDGGLDRLCVGDHVSFHGGTGNDGLVEATALAVLSERITVATSVFQLPLRHPVPVARQVVTLAGLAPGRFEFGVGVGGEDRAEVRVCGVDPATRGARMDESLQIVRRLLAGEEVTFTGEHFVLEEARLRPAPDPAVPILVGGRSAAALDRVARLGDGWSAVWVSPRRFAEATGQIADAAADAGRRPVEWRHGLQVWCAFGAEEDGASTRLAEAMEGFYRIPFSSFARYCPAGPPEKVAELLAPYLDAGCRDINLIAVADTWQDTVDGAVRVRELLSGGGRSPTTRSGAPRGPAVLAR